MNTFLPTHVRRKALFLSAVAAAVLASSLAYGTNDAAAAYTARVQAGTLLIAGDAASDVITVFATTGAPAVVQIDVGADGTVEYTFDRADFTAIEIRAGGGDDTIQLVGGGFVDEATTIRGEGGDDTIVGAAGEQQVFGGSGEDTITAGQGADTVVLGGGADRAIWNPGDGSDLIVGDAGVDALAFNGSNAGEIVDISAAGGRVRFTRNIASIALDLDGIEHVGFTALGGADTINAHDLTGTDARSVEVIFGADAALDRVLAHGTDAPEAFAFEASPTGVTVVRPGPDVDVSGSEPGYDSVDVASLGGDDTISTEVGVAGPESLGVDGGEGADTIRFNGSAGPDLLQAVANGTAASVVAAGTSRLDATIESIVLAGLAGDDTITAVGNLAALTALTMDGGGDDDTLLGGNGPDQLLGGRGDDLVDGNQGADSAQLGSGDDSFRWDPGDGSDAVEGQKGVDELAVNGSNAGETIGVLAVADRILFTRNLGSVALDLGGIEHVGFTALGGSDVVEASDLSGTDARSVDVTLADDGVLDVVRARGTDGPDAYSFAASPTGVTIVRPGADMNVSGSEAAFDSVSIAAGGGDDIVATTIGVNGPATLGVDGGEGGDTVRFEGTVAADTIQAVANGTAASVVATGTSRLDAVAVESTLLLGLDGDDTITAVGNLAALTALTMDGGEGDDTLLGSNGADLLLGGDGADTTDGNQGVDRALLGRGDDAFQWDPGDGSDIVEGEAGVDSLVFNGSNAGEIMTLSAAADGRATLTRNIGAIAMDLDGVETVSVLARGSSDAITIGNLGGTDISAVDLDLGGPDTQPDTVVVQGRDARDVVAATLSGAYAVVAGLPATVRIGGAELADVVRIETLGGDDEVTVAPDLATLLTPLVDLGADE